MDNAQKLCTKCKRNLPTSDFFKSKARPDGLQGWCKDCLRAYWRKPAARSKQVARNKEWARRNPETVQGYHLKRTYALSKEDFAAMRENQNGACAICKNEASKLVVDHNHATGKVRALLCVSCNSALGNFRDDANILKSAIDYLVSHESNS